MFMTAQISDDGQYMWNGTEWVPNPAAAAPAAPAAAMPAQAVVAPMMVQQPSSTVVTSSGAPEKSIAVAYLLWFFLGWLGAHQLYMGRGIGIWLISLFTLQGCGIWWLIDLFLIPSSTRMMRTGGQQVIVVH